MKQRIRMAAVQMCAVLGDVEENLRSAERLVRRAFEDGAEWVILPEFFPSAVAFHPTMLGAARPLTGGGPRDLLQSLALEHGRVVGGSFIALRGQRSYNTFVLAFPDGSTWYHDKDQPTMWENCYYEAGRDDGVFATPRGRIGAALCWEFVRVRTARRLRGKVNLVVGGSCWWTLPEKRLPGFPQVLHERNLEILRETPARFARMVGAPVVHAAHAGEFEGFLPLFPGFSYRSRYLGETQIVDAEGRLLGRLRGEDGEGVLIAEVELGKNMPPTDPIPERFWIPDLPLQFRLVWALQNLHGRVYYRRKVLHSRVYPKSGPPYATAGN